MSDFIEEQTYQSNEKSNAIGRATKVIESLRDEVTFFPKNQSSII